MPHLLLVDDDGRELMRSAVSADNVAIVGGFLRRNAAAFHGLAVFTRSVRQLLDQGAAVMSKLEPVIPVKKNPRRVPAQRRRK